MKIFTVETEDADPGEYPALTLLPDTWDDYGFKTTFIAYFWLAPGNALPLSAVKIVSYDQKAERTELEPSYPDGLPNQYASLGTAFEFYQRVSDLEPFSEEILNSLCDLATDAERYNRFQHQHAFNASLRRLAPAQDALRQVRAVLLRQASESEDDPETDGVPNVGEPLLDTRVESDQRSSVVEEIRQEETAPSKRIDTPPLILIYYPRSRDPQTERMPMTFNFGGPADLPSRLITLVGPNGTGKTTLLAELAARIFFGGGPMPIEDPVETPSGSVRDVIFISYSAYDSFEIPQAQELSGDVWHALADQGYVYIGLRRLDAAMMKTAAKDRVHELKSIGEIERDFAENLAKLRRDTNDTALKGERFDRVAIFDSAIKQLFEDPSLAAITRLGRVRTDKGLNTRLAAIFPGLSTGHKAILNIVASLCLRLNPNSLVLMDEPEAHLHPPLIASLLRVVRSLLERFQAHAIVATHSPVVVQETLAEHVLILRRIDNRTSWQFSRRQTFGENIAALTRETFGLPAARADYIGRLEAMVASDMSIDEIEARFGAAGMSSPARAQALRLLGQKQMAKIK